MGPISRVSSRTYRESLNNTMRSSIVRALSSSAAKANTIPTFGVAGNYAQALHGAAARKGAKEQVSKDIAALQGALENAKINDFLASPFVEAKQKMNIVTDVANKLSLSPLIVNLFSVLAENHRLGEIREIGEVYARIIQAEQGFTPVKITSASALSKGQEKEVSAAVAAIVGGGNVQIETEVNADLVGGLVVSIGDKYTEMNHIDLSTSTKLKKYQALLKQGV